jgi:hypothetical protein
LDYFWLGGAAGFLFRISAGHNVAVLTEQPMMQAGA